jgi:hypothetical protein
MELNVRNQNGVLKFSVTGAGAIQMYHSLGLDSKFKKKEIVLVGDGVHMAFFATVPVTMTFFEYIEVFLNTDSYIVIKP